MNDVCITHPLSSVIEQHGLNGVGRWCGVTGKAVYKWLLQQKMPRTEWTGETQHVINIIAQVPELTKAQLLAPWPAWQPNKRRSKVVASSPSDNVAQSC